MSWTQGQQNRTNQSPFIDPQGEERPHTRTGNPGYNRTPAARPDYSNQRTPNATRVAPTKDVAATFTQEGLQTFSTIFASTVEAAIAKNLPDVFEKVLDRKLEQLALQVKVQIDDLVERISKEVVENWKAQSADLGRLNMPQAPGSYSHDLNPQAAFTAEPKVAIPAEFPAENPLTQPAMLEQTTPDQETAIPDAEQDLDHDSEVLAVMKALESHGQPAKIDQIRELAPQIVWGKNPSLKMASLMHRSNGQIVRIARGTYQFQQS